MSMHTIVVASRKGGVGKTTIAGHLGVMAERDLGPVALIDTDPQGSLASWWNARSASTPAFVSTAIDRLQQHIQRLSDGGCRLAIIDTPPSVTETIRAVLDAADLVLIPTRPSPHDLRAIGLTVELAEAAEKKPRIVFVINGAVPRARITGEAAVILSQHGTVAPVTLYNRTDYATSMIDGRTAQEIDPKGKSAAEVQELWKYVLVQLRKKR